MFYGTTDKAETYEQCATYKAKEQHIQTKNSRIKKCIVQPKAPQA